jgi:hypothetical protein
VPPVKRLLKLVGTALGFVLYVWYAAVRLAPRVKIRKRQRARR